MPLRGATLPFFSPSLPVEEPTEALRGASMPLFPPLLPVEGAAVALRGASLPPRAVGGLWKEGVASKAGAVHMRWRVVAQRMGGGFGPVDRPEGRA